MTLTHVENLKLRQSNIIDRLTISNSEIVQRKLEAEIEEVEAAINSAKKSKPKQDLTQEQIDAYFVKAKDRLEHPRKFIEKALTKAELEKSWQTIFVQPPTYTEINSGTPALTLLYRLSRILGYHAAARRKWRFSCYSKLFELYFHETREFHHLPSTAQLLNLHLNFHTGYDSAVRLAEALNELAPGDTPKKSMFVTTGAEAVENAVKIARAHTGRRAVIAFDGGYHGRTNFTLGLTGKNAPYKLGFGPFPSDIYRAPFPIPYHGITLEHTLAAIEKIFTCDIVPTEVAAIIVEPVQGEGGFYPASDEFLRALRSICDEHGIVMIADEIQSGFGRTGKFFCMEHSGVEPDLMTVAKGMAGGYPIAGVVGKADIMDAPAPGGLGGTYAGSPVGCSAALAVIEVIKEEKLLDASNHIGVIFKTRLEAIQAKHPNLIGELRMD